jgi:hypothetical protein
VNKVLPSFECLQEMAIQDPEALERLRQQHVAAAIKTAPEEYRSRLEGLQFQIDGQRRVSKNPMASCINISKMMHESLHKLRGFIDGANEDKGAQQEDKAIVLSFPRTLF